MSVEKKVVMIDGYQAYALTSDAPNNEAALREIEAWCRSNSCTRSGERDLVRSMPQGRLVYQSFAYPVEATANRGKQIFQDKIAHKLDEAQSGRIIAIDVESEAFEIADSELRALDLLEASHQNARVYLMKIGYPALVNVGAVVRRDSR